MVGTAVYQVGPGLLHLGEEFQRIEPWGAEHGAAARKRSGKAGDQPVDMEQGHHIERPVGFGKLERGRDVAGRGPDVGMAQQRDLRPRSGARGVQNKRDVMGFGGL